MSETSRAAHVHHVGCAFGSPDCPEFGDPECYPKTGWLSGKTYCAIHGRSAGWPCTPPAPEPTTETSDERTGVMSEERQAAEKAHPAEGECGSCGEGIPEQECPKSKRPCGHHCNHVWTHDVCDWCGVEFGGDECDRCEGTGDIYGRSSGPIAACPDCGGRGVIPPGTPTSERDA